MANIPENKVFSIGDNFLETALRSIERAQQYSHYTMAGGGNHPCGDPERAAKQMLRVIGMVLATGGDCPDNIKRWLGNALMDISEGTNPSQALCLARPNKRPNEKSTFIYAVYTEALCLLGISQEQAAIIVADIYGERDKKDQSTVKTDISTIKKAHNQLKNRRGLFKRLKGTFLQATKTHYEPMPESPTNPVTELLENDGIEEDESPETFWANIWREYDELNKKKGRYLRDEQARVMPESPDKGIVDKIIDEYYDTVSLELIFPGDWVGEILSQKPKPGEHPFYDNPEYIAAIKEDEKNGIKWIEEKYLLDEARKILRPSTGNQTKRYRTGT